MDWPVEAGKLIYQAACSEGRRKLLFKSVVSFHLTCRGSSRISCMLTTFPTLKFSLICILDPLPIAGKLAFVVELESTLYGKSVSIVKFDGIYELKKRLGRGMLFKNSASLYNAFISGKASDLNFAAVPGPVNLAICTGGTKKFSLQGLKSCLLNKTCTVGFAVSVWVQPPPKSFIAEKDTVIVDIGAFKLLYGTPLCNDATAPGYKFQFESGGEICTWSMGVNCTSSQAWTQLLISFDNTNSQVFAIENGIMTKAVKYSCTAATPSPVEAAVGGSAMHVCIDELVLWDAPLKASLAIKNSCVFGHCGEYSLKKHKFLLIYFLQLLQ